MLSTSNSPYSPIQNPCHISVIFCTCHYLCLFQSFFISQKFFKVTTFITETFGKMTCIFLSTNLPSISVIPKKLENFLPFYVIFCLLLLKIQKYNKINEIYKIDTFMAPSLRLLAGFCIGEYGEFEVESYYYNYSQVSKKIPHFHTAVLQYSKYSRYPKNIYCICSICNISCKFPVFIIYQKYVMIFSKIDNLGIIKNIGILFPDQKK